MPPPTGQVVQGRGEGDEPTLWGTRSNGERVRMLGMMTSANVTTACCWPSLVDWEDPAAGRPLVLLGETLRRGRLSPVLNGGTDRSSIVAGKGPSPCVRALWSVPVQNDSILSPGPRSCLPGDA